MKALIHKMDTFWHIFLVDDSDPHDVIEICTLLDCTQTRFAQFERIALDECECFDYRCVDGECYKFEELVAGKEFIIQPSKKIGEFHPTRVESKMRAEINECSTEEEVLVVLYKYYGGEG